MKRPMAWPGCWLIAMAALAAIGASPPEVVKIRVPSSKVSRWFPPGSDLQVLPFDQFEELIKRGRDRPPTPQAPRLLRARHSARWDAGMLIGRTELIVDGGPGFLPIEPWSPALIDRRGSPASLRTTMDGKLALKVGASDPPVVEFDWVLRSRANSEGRAFAIALPDIGVSSIALDLPSGLVPEAAAGPRVGPEPGSNPGRASWRFEAARGAIELQLSEPAVAIDRAELLSHWIEGNTEFNLNASPINWRADWTLDESPGASRLLTIDLDAGLDLVDVTGPRVASFGSSTVGAGSRVLIRLEAESEGSRGAPSPLTIRAIGRVPTEGTWAIPSARPLDATWTGGRTTIKLDATRVLQSCTTKAGRRLSPGPGDFVNLPVVAFESDGRPGLIAELTFRKPTAEATVEVRGLLRLDGDVPRIEAALTWEVDKGRLLAHSADLPSGWSPDAAFSADGSPIPWHAEKLSSGGTRIHFGPPSTVDDARWLTITLIAEANRSGITGPLDLPRIRPGPGARVLDEIWVATPDPDLVVRPILGRGLVWIDPPDPRVDDRPTPWVAGDLEGSLAWRWVAEDAEARIDRAPPVDDSRGEVKLEATIRAGHLTLDWSIEVESSRGDLASIPLFFDGPSLAPIAWKSPEIGGPPIESRPIDEARRAALGFPATGPAWELFPTNSPGGRTRIQGRCELPWTGQGPLPILSLPSRYQTKGLVTILVENGTRLRVDSSGLSRIEPTRSIDESGAEPGSTSPTTDLNLRTSAVYRYQTAGGRIQIETIPADPLQKGGLIRDAFLTSFLFPGAGMRHRLTLSIVADSSRSVAMTMPDGLSVDRIRRDGLLVVPTTTDGPILVEIPSPGPGRPFCTLTIDYRSVENLNPRSIEPSRFLPGCSLPCASFAWDIVTPGSWAIARIDPGLEPTEPHPIVSIASRLLGFHWSPWANRVGAQTEALRGSMLRDMDQAASVRAEGELSLGDWLLKLDAGRWPLVIDRAAIRSIGVGPNSRIGSNGDGSRSPGEAGALLQSLGMVAIPLDGVMLITARDEGPAGPEEIQAWSDRLRAVPVSGSDATDRFQSADRWWGEATPRSLEAGDSTDRGPSHGGWHVARLVAIGWTEAGVTVRLIDESSDRAWGWFVAAIVLASGIFARGLPPRWRSLGLATIGIVATFGMAWTWPDVTSTDVGLIRGALGVVMFWIGRSCRPIRSTLPNGLAESSTRSRNTRVIAGASVAVVLIVSTVTEISAGSVSEFDQDDAPILVLLPFDGPADPARKPDRVILLLKDFERLTLLARPDQTPVPARVSLVTASHRVERDRPDLAVVESRFEIEVDSGGPFSWTFPVGQARELSASVDDQPTPLAISADGLSATVALDGPGTYQLQFRRLIPLRPIARGGDRVLLPINRSASSRVVVAKGTGASWVEVPDACGRLTIEPGGIEGEFGPGENLEVRWFPDDRPVLPKIEGPADATFLWDARPVGDLIRMKLVHDDPEGVSTIRLAVEPGLVVRRSSIPGVVSVRREGTADRPEWVARVAPAWPRGVPIEVDFWRPAVLGSVDRRWPRIEILSASKLSALLGFRRPSDWSGQLEPRRGIETIPDLSFVKSWGVLPVDGMTLAGVVRLDGTTTLEVAVAPPPIRRSISTKVIASFGPGRLTTTIEAIATERQGRTFELEVSLPSDLRIMKVEATGLLDWQKIARDRLRLQFDGSESPARKIRIEGYLPILPDAILSETRTFSAKIPCPRWSIEDESPVLLEISGPTRFQVEAGEGAELVVPLEAVDAPSAFRSSYRVEPGSGPLTIRWTSPPAQVDVSVDSELTIDPSSLSWTAALTCDVSGGPAESLSWNLPTVWATSASLEVAGMGHRLVSQPSGTRGQTTQWTILPDSPLWGRVRIVVRSRRAIAPGIRFDYPQISPLAKSGRGAVRRYDLSIVNESGRSLEVAGSPGLQPMDVARFRSVESTSSNRSIDRAYHVTGERWALRVNVGREGDDAKTSNGDRATRVALARLSCLIGLNGETWGRASYDLEPRPGPFLTITLDDRAEIPWASVDGVVGRALPDGPGRWLVPLGDRRPARVILSWHMAGDWPLIGKPEPVVVPTIDQPACPTLISIDTPVTFEIAVEGRRSEGLDRISWEVENVEQVSRRIVEGLGELDRSLRRARERIVDDLTEMELRRRRIARGSLASNPPGEQALGRIQASLTSIAEASQASGLDELIEESRARVGLSRSLEDSIDEMPTRTPEIARVRRSGRSWLFRPSGGQLPTITRVLLPTPNRTGQAGMWAAAGLLVVLWLGVATWIDRQFRPRVWVWLGLAILLVSVIAAWEPLGAIAVIAVVGWGRASP